MSFNVPGSLCARTALVAVALGSALAFPVTAQNSPGKVTSGAKISSTSGSGPVSADGDRFGEAVAALGDLDNDGVEDIAVGAYFADAGGTDRGQVYVLFLNSDGSVKSSTSIGHGTAGISLADGDWFGRSLAGLDDVDGDGVTDLAIGAVKDDTGGPDRGAVYVCMLNTNGTVKGTATKITSASVAGIADGDFFGNAVSSIGDLDTDGVCDLAIGAIRDDTGGSNRGAVYVCFLNADGTVDSSVKLADGTGGFSGVLANGDEFGESIADLGDVDDDGVTDLVVGAPRSDVGGADRGSVFVVFMNANGTAKGQLKIADGAGGFAGGQLDDSDFFGWSVARLGDLDNDDVPDMAVGAVLDDDGGTNRGAFYVLFLTATGTVKSSVKVSDTTGLLAGGGIAVLDNDDSFGRSLACPGDINGDLINDLVIGAYLDDDGGPDRGAVWVGFMHSSIIEDLGNALPGTNGTALLDGIGSMVPGESFRLNLTNAKGSAPLFIFIGFFAINAPFKGGTLVPDAGLTFAFATSPSGTFPIGPLPWPAGIPTGFQLWIQEWFADAGGPNGAAASNAIRLKTP